VPAVQVALTVKCAMTEYQSAIYSWVKATGTIRLDPLGHLVGKVHRPFVPLNNTCMELRKVGWGPLAPTPGPSP
jgi:SWI/SNF-related matrix-associated actin-dependent regulator of chromatin subfamily A member 2/4